MNPRPAPEEDPVMKRQLQHLRASAPLRSRAEEQLKRCTLQEGGTRPNSTRLVHELQIHEIELQMQNEELLQAHTEAKALLAQFTELYDLAPTGYLTLDRNGLIRQVNLAGAGLLGVERSGLLERRLGLFVAPGERRTFADFLLRVFSNHAKESCEVQLDAAALRVACNTYVGIGYGAEAARPIPSCTVQRLRGKRASPFPPTT